MKIIGFVYCKGEGLKADGEWEMVLKCDSCLLNGRKPFFIPEWTHEPVVSDCYVLRVSRLGKEIAPRFAHRYYDAVAPGADFAALDKLRAAQAAGRPWTQALAFDYSLAIGEWTNGEWLMANGEWVLSPEEAIAEASKVMTIRQGDLIYVTSRKGSRPIQKEDIVCAETDGQQTLYCKIK